MPKLPIFPLNTVLFPGYELPLRIFEQRYKTMLSDCLNLDGRFVIALISDGVEVGGDAIPREIATVARIKNAGDLNDEVIPITTIGDHRVRILELDRSLPYLSGDVETIPEPRDEHIDSSLLKRAQTATERFARVMLMQLRGEWRANPKIPSDPALLGYKMGTLLADQPTAAQRVLEAESINGRLQQAAPAIEALAAQFEARLMEQAAADHRRGKHRN